MNLFTDSPAPKVSGNTSTGRELRVLLAEDSENDVLLAVDALREGGYTPVFERVETAAEMRNALAGKEWDLVLSDYQISGFNAFEAFAIYREFRLDIPFLIVSGLIGEETAVAAMKLGVHDYINKSNLGRLAPAVRRELQEAENRLQRVRAEAELRAAYAELAAIHGSVPATLLVIDENHRIRQPKEERFANRQAELFGACPGAAFGCARYFGAGKYHSLCAVCPIQLAVLDTLDTGRRHSNLETWIPVSNDPNAGRKCLLVSTAPLDCVGAKKILLCAQDVTELKEAQIELEKRHAELGESQRQLLESNRDLDRKVAELKDALAGKDVLLREVQHRVKNNLQVISSLLSLQAERPGSEVARIALGESRDRVRSMALIHEQLTYSEEIAEIEFGSYVRQLVAYLLNSYSISSDRVIVHSEVDIALPLNEAVTCGFILQELLSNSLKHAFPNNRHGEISIDFHERGENYCLRYRDNGIGLPSGFDMKARSSLGTQLISDLTGQLQGEVRYSSSAVTEFDVTFPTGKRQLRLGRPA